MMKKPLAITAVEVNCTGGGWFASCNYRGCRYHFLFDPAAPHIAKYNVLYKNSPMGVQRGDHGYFPTLRLNAKSQFSSRLIDSIMAVVKRDGLIAKARQESAEKKACHEKEMKESGRIYTIRQAGVELYDALKVILHTSIIRDFLAGKDMKALKQAERAIAKAEGRA